jgi:hypothetical protein
MPAIYSWHFAGKARGGGGGAPEVGGGDTPAWLAGVDVGEWVEISGSNMSACPISVVTYPPRGNTGPSSKIEAWTSLVLDPTASVLYSPANGGHKDYGGSEVDAITLTDDAPEWSEVCPSCTAAELPDHDATTGLSNYYGSKPVSRHTFYGASFNPVRNRVHIYGGAAYTTGYKLSTMDGYNPSTDTWDAAATYTNVPSGVIGIDYPACSDPVTGDVYWFSANNVFKWTSTTNVWSTAASGPWAQAGAAIFDSSRNRILIFGGDSSYTGTASASHVYTLGSTTSTVTFTGAGASSIQEQNYCGAVYDPVGDRFLVRTRVSGGTVYQIHPTTWDVTAFSTSGGGSVPAAVAGVFHRWLYVPALGGIVFAPTYSGNLWFLRTS